MLLNIKNLTKEYKRGTSLFQAVDHAEISVSTGEFVSVIGRSGSGKSTFLNMIAGLIAPTLGSIEVDGQDILLKNDKAISFYRNSKIGYIPQGFSALSNLTVFDNVALPYYFYKREGNVSEKVFDLLAKVGILHLAQSYPKQLSGGELRRVSIARALINDPSILLADEPTGDLDKKSTVDIMQLFHEIAKNNTAIIMVTHELETVKYSDSLYVMDSGLLTRRDKKEYTDNQ